MIRSARTGSAEIGSEREPAEANAAIKSGEGIRRCIIVSLRGSGLINRRHRDRGEWIACRLCRVIVVLDRRRSRHLPTCFAALTVHSTLAGGAAPASRHATTRARFEGSPPGKATAAFGNPLGRTATTLGLLFFAAGFAVGASTRRGWRTLQGYRDDRKPNQRACGDAFGNPHDEQSFARRPSSGAERLHSCLSAIAEGNRR